MTSYQAVLGYDPGGNSGYKNKDKRYLNNQSVQGAAVLILDHKYRIVKVYGERKPNNKKRVSVNDIMIWYDQIINRENATVIAAGIDSCLSWNIHSESGMRPMDDFLKRTYRDVEKSVIAPNYLNGSMLIQGICMAIEIERCYKKDLLFINETHPKIGYWAELKKKHSYSTNMWWELLGRIVQYNDSIGVADFFDQTPYTDVSSASRESDDVWDAIYSAYFTVMYSRLINPNRKLNNDLISGHIQNLIIPQQIQTKIQYLWI
ncbi:hypothetical protein D3C75_651950 [compost metagenome]